MAGKKPPLSNTDLRRGLFTAGSRAVEPVPVKREGATGSEEQLLLFGEAAPGAKTDQNQALQAARSRDSG